MMQTCPACGHENRETARYCGGCAAPLVREVTCHGCGAPNPSAQKFCDTCGAALEGRASRRAVGEDQDGSAGASPSQRSPRSYTPKHLADKILTSRAALEGERKQVTVLFADVKGSMELAEQVDPEEWHQILDRFFQILSDGVHRFEGTVNQYTGDGIMALFGAPIAHEDHAQRACYAALHLRDELRRYANELRVSHGLSFFVRMGLNSGEVIVGTIGDDLRMDYTAQGQVVGLAQRMEQLAEPGRVCLTGETARLVSGYFQLAALGPLQVKGVSAPVEIFELDGAGMSRTRLDVSRARGFTRFVGRDSEMRLLETALERTLNGEAQIVGVVGEAGVGKSRLCVEFLDRCRARGVAVYEAHCLSHGDALPFLPVVQLFRGYFGIRETDAAADARRRIAGTLLLLDERFREALPLIFDFLGVPDPGRPVPRMDPETRLRQLLAFASELIRARSAQEPAVLLVDDLHWVDRSSDATLGQVIPSAGDTRTLFLLNFRPEYHADWMTRADYQQLALRPLGPEATVELLRELLGSDPALASLTARLRERAGGNPFFAEELVRSLVDCGDLAGQAGHYRLVGDADRVTIPATVQSLLAARIDRLPEGDKEVLQTAAVIGKEFGEPLLRAVLFPPSAERVDQREQRALRPGSGHASRASARTVSELISFKTTEHSARPEEAPSFRGRLEGPARDLLAVSFEGEEDLASALDRLGRAEFIVARALYPEAEYSFRHPLVQEMAYRTQLGERRARVHAQVAQALERQHAGQLDENATLLAHHWEAAGEALAALRWHARAAAWFGPRDLLQSLSHQQRVRTLAAQVPQSIEAQTLGARACAWILHVGWRIGLPANEREAIFAQGRAWAERSGDAGVLARVLDAQAALLSVMSEDLGAARTLIDEARELAERTDDLSLRVAIEYRIGWILWLTANASEGLAHLERGIALAGHDVTLGVDVTGWSSLLFMLAFRGNALVALGRLREAAHAAEEAERLAIQHQDLESQVDAWVLKSSLALVAGDPEAARHGAQQLLEMAERLGTALWQAMGFSRLASALVECGEFDQALAAAERALAITAEAPASFVQAETAAAKARALLGVGDVQQARVAAREALELCERWAQIPKSQMIAVAAAAHVLLRTEGPTAPVATRALEWWAQLVEQLHNWADRPHLHCEWAERARLLGDNATYQRELREAHRLFVEMGATGHAERISRQLAAVSPQQGEKAKEKRSKRKDQGRRGKK